MAALKVDPDATSNAFSAVATGPPDSVAPEDVLSRTQPLSARIAALKAELDRLTDGSASKGLGSAEQELRRLVDTLSSEVSSYLGTTQEKVSAYVSETHDQAERSIRAQPLAAVAACFLAGVMVGRLWGRR